MIKEDFLKNYTELISSGSTPKGGSDNYLDQGEILFIRSQNVLMNKFSDHDALYIPLGIHEKMKRTWVKNGDVLINITGASIGRTTVYLGEDNKANVNQHVCIIRLKDFKTINPFYLSYFLSSNSFQKYIVKINAGATRQALNFSQIGKFKIPIPPIETQKRIVEMIKKAEKLKEWRTESDELADDYLKSLFNQMFLNQDFETGNLKNYTQLISSGSTPKGGSDNYLDEGEILFIRSQNVRMNKFSDHDSLYLPLELHNQMKRTWVKNKDVLLNITGASIGRTTIYEGESDKANVNQHVCIIRLKDFKTLNPTYLSYYLASSIIQKHIIQKNAGATRQALNFTQIGKFKIPIPPIELQTKFAEAVEIIETLKTHRAQSKQEIDNLFNTLMQKAFKGELVC